MKKFALIFKIFALLLWMSTTSLAQTIGSDQCAVHLDKSFYVNGEVIWYKLYLPNSFAGKNPSIKVKLLNEAGRTLYYTFLRTNGKLQADSYFKIPYGFISGVYHLVFIANKEKGKDPIVLAEVSVPIYNDDPKAMATLASSAPREWTAGASEGVPDDLQVNISVDQSQIKSRDPVRVRVSVRDQSGQPVKTSLSVSVTDWDLLNRGTLDMGTITPGNAYSSDIVQLLDTALYTKVRVSDNTGTPIQANVLGVFSPADNQFQYAKSQADGYSFIELNDFWGPSFFQLLGYYKEIAEIDVSLIEENIPLSRTGKLIYNEGIEAYLRLSRLRKKIFQHRTAVEFELSPELPAVNINTLEPDLTINVQDYESFDDLGAFLKEITTPLRFRQRNDSTYYAEMSNPGAQDNNFFFSGDPLFIIDGKLTHNAGFVATMPPDQVQEIALFFRREKLRDYFKVFGGSGVVIINTSIPDIEIPSEDARDILQVNGLNAKVDFPEFDPAQLSEDPNQAFFRPQLYWNPGLQTDENGEATFSFFQSDDLSTFRIEVMAQSDQGELGRETFEYEVK